MSSAHEPMHCNSSLDSMLGERWICRSVSGGFPPLLTGGRGLQGRVPLTLPLPPAVAGADALEQVPPIILLAPGISDSVRCPGVLIVASVCVRKKALKYVNQVDLAHAQLKLKNTYSSLKLGMLCYFFMMFLSAVALQG